jgi:hypothetical protein
VKALTLMAAIVFVAAVAVIGLSTSGVVALATASAGDGSAGRVTASSRDRGGSRSAAGAEAASASAHPWKFRRIVGARTFELAVGWIACNRQLMPKFESKVTERPGRAIVTVIERMADASGVRCLKVRGSHHMRIRLRAPVRGLTLFDGSSSPPTLRFSGS